MLWRSAVVGIAALLASRYSRLVVVTATRAALCADSVFPHDLPTHAGNLLDGDDQLRAGEKVGRASSDVPVSGLYECPVDRPKTNQTSARQPTAKIVSPMTRIHRS